MKAQLRNIITSWALFGGLVLIVLVLLTAYSLLAGWLFNAPLAGQFELVEMGVAVAAFAFLPYCQMTNANVSADIFTSRAGPLTLMVFNMLAGLIALVFSVVLFWRMWLGLMDYREFPEFTAIMEIPIWYAYVPILVSLVLLMLACFVTVADGIGAARRQINRGAPQ